MELCEDRSSLLVGTLRVGLIPTLGPYILPRVAGVLAQRFPGLQLRVEELRTEAIAARLREETLDVGLIATPQLAPDIFQWRLFTEPLLGYVHIGHPLASRHELRLDDVKTRDLWLLSEAHCFGQQTRALCQLDARPNGDCASPAETIRFESGNLETLKQLVEHNGGITLLPALAIEAAQHVPAAVTVKPCAAPIPTRQISLASRRAFMKQQLVDALIDTLLETVPNDVVFDKARPGRWREPVPEQH